MRPMSSLRSLSARNTRAKFEVSHLEPAQGKMRGRASW